MPVNTFSCTVITSVKGGVGKTAISRSLAEYFSIVRGKRVLVLDLDINCSISELYLTMVKSKKQGVSPPIHPEYDPKTDLDWDGYSSSADIFRGKVQIVPYPVEFPEAARERLSILPGDQEKLKQAEQLDKHLKDGEIVNNIRTFVRNVKESGDYDLMIIDTGPNTTLIGACALAASSHVIIPIVCEALAVNALNSLFSSIWKEQSKRAPGDLLELVCIQPNMFKNWAIHESFLQAVRETFSDAISPVVIPHRAVLAERDVDGVKPKSIYEMKGRAADVAAIMLNFGKYVEGRIFNKERAV